MLGPALPRRLLVLTLAIGRGKGRKETRLHYPLSTVLFTRCSGTVSNTVQIKQTQHHSFLHFFLLRPISSMSPSRGPCPLARLSSFSPKDGCTCKGLPSPYIRRIATPARASRAHRPGCARREMGDGFSGHSLYKCMYSVHTYILLIVLTYLRMGPGSTDTCYCVRRTYGVRSTPFFVLGTLRTHYRTHTPYSGRCPRWCPYGLHCPPYLLRTPNSVRGTP